jgi:hypothetical protein
LSTTAASIAGTLAVTGNAAFDTNTLFVDAAANEVGIGTATPSGKLHVSSTGDTYFVLTGGVIPRTFSLLADANDLRLFNGIADSLVARFTPTGVVEVGSGIQFPATQVASADVNTLDDYEEGTWTMGVAFGGASVGVTTSSNTGTYTKIGRQVTINGYLELTSKGSSTGAAIITGLPFTIANNNANYSSASLTLNRITFANQFQGRGNINATTIALQEITILGAVTNLTNSDFADDSTIMVSLTYFV